VNKPNYSWPSCSEDIVAQIKAKESTLKIVLKTKNETEILDQWLEHHLNIAGDFNVLVFDNGSTNPKTFDIYGKYRDRINLFGFYENHNLIHNTDYFSKFYQALRESCKFYTFIDTDEFLYFTDGNVLLSDSDFMDVLNRTSDNHIFLGLWSFNVPGNRDLFYISDISNRYSSGLKGGKPLISSTYDLKGFINHNIQLYQNNSQIEPVGGLLVCHLNMLDRERRIMINREKILAHKFLNNHDEIDAMILSNDFSKLSGNLANYIKEIVQCRDQEWTVRDQPPSGCFKINIDRSITFSDEKAHIKLLEFTSQCSLGWSKMT
jgi:hypothetical protein